MNYEKLKNKSVAVFFGGRSPEHDVSILTGMVVMRALHSLQIDFHPVYISTDGAWNLGDDLKNEKFLKSIHTQKLYKLQRWSLDTRHREQKLILSRRPNFLSRREQVKFDLVFPTFHGSFGEDGTFQGLCEMFSVPYVGCGVQTSSVSMDKHASKVMAKSIGLNVVKDVRVSCTDWASGVDSVIHEVTKKLTFPLMVKPTHAGSSIGISRAGDKNELKKAIDLALNFDTHCLVEVAIDPMQDLTCCIRQDANAHHEATLVQESSYEGSDFFSYEEKYLKDGGVQTGNARQRITIPANVPDHIASQVQNESLQVAKELGITGIGRVDYLYNPSTEQLYFNEVNPLPGTLYTHLWKKSDITPEQLVSDLLVNAYRAHEQTTFKARYFHSNILENKSNIKLKK